MNTNWNDPNFQGFGGRQSPFGKRPPRPKKEHKAIGTPLSRTLINLAVTLIFAAVYFYVVLPPINLQAEEFYFFMLLCCAVYCGCAVLTSGFQGSGAKGYFGFVKKQCRIPMIIAVALVAVAIVGGIVGWQVIRAGAYRDLLTVETGDFATEVEEISYDQIPMLDKDSAEKLGNRKLGELSDMVSQFEVAEEYTQINYKGRPVRVTPLRYGDWIKWFNNRSRGLPAYLIIDMVTQNVEVVRLEQGIRYTTAEHFGRNLYRYLQFHYPTYIFDKPAFEIDEEGNPYWVCPRIRKTIGLFGGTDIDGAVLVSISTMTPRMCRTGWITSTRRISSSSSTTTTVPISTASSTPCSASGMSPLPPMAITTSPSETTCICTPASRRWCRISPTSASSSPTSAPRRHVFTPWPAPRSTPPWIRHGGRCSR